MDQSIVVALFALGGVLTGGLLTGYFQRANTKIIIAAEKDSLRMRLEGEADKRLLARKQDWLMEIVPELIAAADPELHVKFDYKKVVTIIHRIQLLINQHNSAENRLNSAVSDLGFAVQEAVAEERDSARLLRAQAEVTEATREILNN